MSRWVEQFEQHPFQLPWKELKKNLVTLSVDDESVETDIEEIARLKKVVTFVDELIKAADPELVPSSVWKNFNGQCQSCVNEVNYYVSNRDMTHIRNANANADNLLTYVRPFIVNQGQAVEAANSAFAQYQTSIRDGLSKFKQDSLEYYKEFKDYSSELRDLKIEFDKKFKELRSIHSELDSTNQIYLDKEVALAEIDQKISTRADSVEDYFSQVKAYYSDLLASGSDSIKSEVEEAKREVESNHKSIEILLHETEEELSVLKSFYTDIIGKENDEGELEGGLKEEINKRRAELEKFKSEQTTRFHELSAQIESLLPGATSAGLANAYRAMRKSFNKPVKQYSKLFYVSIAVLFVVAFVSVVDAVWSNGEFMKFVDVSDPKVFLSNLAHKLPIILPVLWLAIFASKRRSEAQRLQQEYAHKEALAKSYQSFKNQIDNLQSDSKEQLLEKLLTAAIDAVSSNASSTLDKKHGDNSPVHEVVEKVINKINIKNEAANK